MTRIVNHKAIFTGHNGTLPPSDLLIMQNSDEETIIFDCMFEDGSAYTFSSGDVVTGNFTSITTGVGYVVSGIITPETDESTMSWVCDPADVGLPDVYDLSFKVETTGGLFAHTKIFKYTIVEVPNGIITPPTIDVVSTFVKTWAATPLLFATSIIYNSSYIGEPETAVLEWPDGSAGVYTVTARSAVNASLGKRDAYTASHTESGIVATQTAVTRNTNGMIVISPALTIS